MSLKGKGKGMSKNVLFCCLESYFSLEVQLFKKKSFLYDKSPYLYPENGKSNLWDNAMDSN